MSVLKIKQNGTWHDVSGLSEHTHTISDITDFNVDSSVAQEALEKANAAQSVANTAQNTANTAQSTAQEALEKANAAQNTSNTAQSTANQGVSDAAIAWHAAVNAESIANAAMPKSGGRFTGDVGNDFAAPAYNSSFRNITTLTSTWEAFNASTSRIIMLRK